MPKPAIAQNTGFLFHQVRTDPALFIGFRQLNKVLSRVSNLLNRGVQVSSPIRTVSLMEVYNPHSWSWDIGVIQRGSFD